MYFILDSSEISQLCVAKCIRQTLSSEEEERKKEKKKGKKRGKNKQKGFSWSWSLQFVKAVVETQLVNLTT